MDLRSDHFLKKGSRSGSLDPESKDPKGMVKSTSTCPIANLTNWSQEFQIIRQAEKLNGPDPSQGYVCEMFFQFVKDINLFYNFA